jgi:hypothetical protein
MPPAAQRPLPPRPPDCVTRTGARSVSSFAAFSKPPAETDVAHASVAAATRRENFFILITILPINSGQAAFRPLKPSLTRNSFFPRGKPCFLRSKFRQKGGNDALCRVQVALIDHFCHRMDVPRADNDSHRTGSCSGLLRRSSVLPAGS